MSETIRVIVRIRPLSTSQLSKQCKSIVSVDEQNNQINLTKPDQPDNIKSFAYDAAFSENAEQTLVYSKAAFELVQHVLEGYNGTVFAYGQTGCGKTHSMLGKTNDEELQGIIPRCFGHVLKTISDTPDKEYLLRCSFLEIYNQQIHDLLGDPKAKLQLKQSPQKGVFVKDLQQKQAKSHAQLMDYLAIGTKNRAVGETAMNKDSSRSHLIFALHLQSASKDGPTKKYVASKLNLVDLAGSQRLSKTGAVGDRMKEAQKINLSLSALGNVISALVEGRSNHIPYRDSKLTRMLQDSLGGNTKTVMLANCSPADYNFEETLSTLRYASRAKLIKNKPIINQDPKDALLKQYANEIQQLKMQLGNGGSIVIKDDAQLHMKLKERQAELQTQKNQKQELLQRIKQLQSRHIQSNQVKVDKKIVQTVKRCSVMLNDRKMKKMTKKAKRQTKDTEEKENKDIVENKQMQSTKVMRLEREIRDIQHQNYLQKQCILQDFRILQKQNKFLQNVLAVMLQPHEIQAIREASQYCEQKQEYRVPPFYLKNRQIVFPKLSNQKGIDMIRVWQDGRHLEMNQKENQQMNNTKEVLKPPKDKKHKEKEPINFNINDILKQARLDNPSGCWASEPRKKGKVVLDPLFRP